jgi:hypothetical protein
MLSIRATDEFKNNHEIAIRSHKIVKEILEYKIKHQYGGKTPSGLLAASVRD